MRISLIIAVGVFLLLAISSDCFAQDSVPFLQGFPGPPFWRGLQLVFASVWLSAAILLALFSWIFASVVSTTPLAALKQRAAISAWIGLPAAPFYLLWLFGSDGVFFRKITAIQISSVLLWTQVFAALFVGGILRRRFFTDRQTPDPLALPLATLVFTINTAIAHNLFIEYGTFPRPSNCHDGPYFPLSICGYYDYEGYYVAGTLLLLILVCGMFLPANSILIVANDRLKVFAATAFIRARAALKAYRERIQQEAEERAKKEAERESNEQQKSQFPPDFPTENAPLKGMALKLTRSERTSSFGKILFVLDARINMSAENRALVAKYRLGDHVVYDSANREAYAQAAREHLAQSRNDTSLFDSPGSQAIGIGKTFWNLGRAAFSATVASISLSVTINSLMRGVHVECKDMGELLEAEGAIVTAAQNLKAHLEAASTFTGREQIIDL